MIPGVDVSSVQGVIDWPRVASSGVRFAWLKCTQGNDGADPTFGRNMKGCRDTGVYVGAYHYAYGLPPRVAGDGRSPQEEARRFFNASSGLGRGYGELPPAIDAEHPEVGKWGQWGCTAPQLSEWLRVFADEVAQLWGRAPIVYTYPFWWRTMAASADVSWAAQYPLWIANYMGIDGTEPPTAGRPFVPPPWADWTVWQWSANKGRRVPGIATDVDRNVFRGNLDGLRRLANVDPDAPTLPDLPSRRPPAVSDFAVVRPLVPLGRPALDGDLPTTQPDDEDEPDPAA